MDREAVLDEFRDAEALLEGHFKLSSGLHSPLYLQCARVLMNPKRAERLCRALIDKIPAAVRDQIDLVVSPAMGGVVVGYEMARQLSVESIFTERVNGSLALRRGFSIPKRAKILMAEDIVTTGLSSRECIDSIRENGGEAIIATCLIDRSDGEADIGIPLYSLVGMKVPAYEPDKLPPELAVIPAIKPGSRGLKA